MVEENPTWYMIGPSLVLGGVGGPDHLAGEPIYDPSDSKSFNLYFKTALGNKIVASTIIPPVISTASMTSQASNSPPVEERRRERVVPQMPPFASKGWQGWNTSFQDGLCHMTYKTEEGFEHCVSSYEDLLRGDWKGTLRIPVTNKGRGDCPPGVWGWKSELSIDEASGRVIVWIGPNDGGGRCYVWDLV